MLLNILVVTNYKWPSRLKKHEEIKKLMMVGGFDGIKISTIHKDLGKPDIKNGRITEAWFEKNISKDAKAGDYNFAIFQFSDKDGRKWGLIDGVRGSTFNDGDFFGESWICSDENDVLRYKDKARLDKYSKVFAHEIAHELKGQGITTLEVHDFDFKGERHDIAGFYQQLNLKKKRLVKWAKYLPEPYFSRITQGFAVPNPMYKVSGHHIGVDHGVKGRTDIPIFMPVTGKITRHLTNDPILGNCAIILSEDEQWAFRMAHMKYPPLNGVYVAGTQIGIVGNTGFSTGEHLHIDCWKNGTIKMDKIINRESILEYCVDAHDLVSKNLI